MDEKKTLPTDLSEKIDGLLRDAGAKNREGNVSESIALGLSAWALLPAPQEQWDFYPQIMSRSLVTKYAAVGNAAGVKQWIDTTYRMYDDPEHRDHLVLMLEGRSLYQLGLTGEAYDIFAKVHELHGREGFAGEDMSYLEFYLKERAQKEP
jgi:hypothetical protein